MLLVQHDRISAAMMTAVVFFPLFGRKGQNCQVPRTLCSHKMFQIKVTYIKRQMHMMVSVDTVTQEYRAIRTHVHAQDNTALSTDISEHVVLCRAAVSLLT